MKKIGLIGGLSYEATTEYYVNMMRKSNQCLGGYHTVEVAMISINPTDILAAVHANNWRKAAAILIKTAKELIKMGATCIVIPCNSLHKLAEKIQANITVPLLNVIDCVGEHVNQKSYQRVALLGTRFTMESQFYHKKLRNQYHVEVITPAAKFRRELHRIIFNELCLGQFERHSKEFIKNLCNDLHLKDHCDAVILGCTELPLLIKQGDVMPSLIDTINLHSDYAVQFVLNVDKLPLCKVA